jgi:predicted outer membrane protein
MLTASAVPAFAQPLVQPMEAMPSMHNSTLPPMDRSFVTDMLQEARAQQAFAKLALQRTSNVSTIRAANAIYSEWTELRGRLAGLALAEAAPVRGALTASQQTELWNLGRTPKARFDRVFLLDAQRGNELAFNRIREEDATSNVQIHQFLDKARPLISGYQAMLTADIGRFPLTARMPTASVGSTLQ